MRLALYTDSFYPELGGIQDSLAAQARSLAARGHEVLIVAPAARAEDFRLSHLAPRELDLGPGVRIARLPSVAMPGSTGQTRLAVNGRPGWRAVRALRPNLIHLQTFLTVGRFGARHAHRLRVPIAGTNHWAADGFGLYAPAAIEAWGARTFMRTVNRFYRTFPLVSAPSRATAAAMRAAGFEQPITVVSNPIDTETFTAISDDQRMLLRRQLDLPGPTVIYAGRLAIEKKVDVLIAAFARLAGQRRGLTLALAGHGSSRSALADQVHRHGLTGRVRFLGALPHRQLADWLRASDLFATASTSESQCMALLQAMACGRASVVANSRALPEMLGPDAGLTVAPDDPAAFACGLARLLDDRALAQRCGQAAVARAARSSVSAVTDQWEALYEALNRHATPHDLDRHTGTQRGGLPRTLP